MDWILAVTGALVLLVVVVVWKKGRPFAPGEVFRASRLSAGNRAFPTQVLITPTSVVHYTPRLVGHTEQSIHMAHVASVRIETGLAFSDVLIETTGGEAAIRCRGHYKGDAIRMKHQIERHQSAYYQTSAGQAPDGLSGPVVPPIR
jgi:hypothetical protein